MSPLLDSLHKEAVEASACQVSARDTGRKEGKDGGKGKDRRSRGMWLELMIKCLTPSLLDVMDAPAKLQLFDDLYVISRQSQRPNVCKAARDSLRKLPLDIGQLDSRLATLCKELQATNATQHRAVKRTKPGLAEASCAEVYPVASVAAAVVVLDSLQVRRKSQLALLYPTYMDLASSGGSLPARVLLSPVCERLVVTWTRYVPGTRGSGARAGSNAASVRCASSNQREQPRDPRR